MSTQIVASMRPSAAYAQGVADGHWESDPRQQAVLQELDRIRDALLEREHGGTLSRLMRHLRSQQPVRGLYLWGRVGRGKTFLVDLFFDQMDAIPRQRTHFHRFMADVHARMQALGEHADPLVQVAADFAREFRLLCLDEFFVSDIGDAMILGRLLEQLFANGVTLVTTSNTAPENLYQDGLQRASFLPAIILLQAHCKVMSMTEGQDWRLRALTQAGTWQVPADAKAEQVLADFFQRLARAPTQAHPKQIRSDAKADAKAASIEINGRQLAVRARASDVIWFDFHELCEGPRGVADYIEIARHNHSVIVSGIPRFDRLNEDAAYRFVLLIDELYDRDVKLIASAAAAPTDLYHGHRALHEFERTTSRLIEMQSREYLEREHRPRAWRST